MTEPSLLIIDDDYNLVDTLKAALESLGYSVATAYDGPDGVKRAKETHPSVIFLDFFLPSEGGASVYQRLRAAPDMAHTPIIISSGASVEEIRQKLNAGPQTYFLKKPVSITQIQSVLTQVLGIQAPPIRARAVPAPPAPPQPSSEGLSGAPLKKSQRAAAAGRGGASLPAALGGDIPPGVPAAPSAPLPSAADAVAAFVRRMNQRIHEFEVRVTYADTDKMGVIYYGNYFKYFELGRTELMRSLGIRYRDLEKDRKLYLPVAETHCEYLGPSHYDDLLLVRTWLSRLGSVSLAFSYEIYHRDKTSKLVARGFTRHAVVGENWRLVRIPSDMNDVLRRALLLLRPS